MSSADTDSGARADLAEQNASANVTERPVTRFRVLIALVQRELWEHRALWMAPLLIGALLVICAIPAHVDFIPDEARDALAERKNQLALFQLLQWGLTVPQYLVMLIVLNFYLLDCLYGERKDRSILFWKSLPVSDGLTVVSKLLVALVIVPLGVYLVSALTDLLFSGIWLSRAALGYLPSWLSGLWDTMAWIKVETLMLTGVVISMFWYAPFAAYLLLVSAWARRNVFLWGLLPPVFAVLLERLAFGTHYVAALIQYRTLGIWETVHLEDAMNHAVIGTGDDRIVFLSSVFNSLDLRAVITNIDLWLGVAVAVGLTILAARIRRYRDDT